MPQEEKHPLYDHKSYLLLFQVEGHRVFRKLEGSTIQSIEHQLKTNIGKAKVIKKKFFEIDHNTAMVEEF